MRICLCIFFSRYFLIGSAAIGVLLGILPWSHAEDWPVGRGDAQGTGVAQSRLPDSPKLLWKRKFTSGLEATAVIAGKMIYLGDVDGTLHAVQLTDGKTVWEKSQEAGYLAAAGVHNGRVYIGDYDGVFRCMDGKTGDILWSFQAGAEYYAGPNFHDNRVLLTCEDGSLYCLDAATGEKQWVFSISAPLRCLPTITNDRAALAGCDSRLHLIDISSGHEVDSVELDSQTGSTPAMVAGRTFFGTESGTFYCLELDPLSVAWTYHDPQRRQPIRSAAAATERWVIFGSQAKQVVALDPKSGDLKWKFPTNSRVDSSPVIAGNHVYFATARGRLFSVDATTGKEIWHYDAGGSFLASPAIASNQLVIGNDDGTLYCFGGSL
ncbi:MAG: PQQ-binding-like beta-propeller repeat protein [Pirellulales bacterium]|nr:PQQ-binding-like beta-propeller repeat protein [Pirellulales bacterium]